ncbi:MAG: hypothetical protein DYG89_16400 [Caldilinea sp. CFX5]|nr:hypothetical protein [Caldilinea sp. CFX5]
MRSTQHALSARLSQRAALALPFLLLLGILLRLGRLAWQPLWADEGYSVYFATESVVRLLWLTANDIHPPLYYLLLHGWLWLWGTPAPLALRLFSVLLAIPVLFLAVALAQSLFAGRRHARLLLLTLLLLNPLYLYYSQEVRMYGLALTLSLATTLCCWRWVAAVNAGQKAGGRLAGYIVVATAALYTLYYLAFLLLAQFVWVLWTLRKARLPLLRFVLADLLVALLYLPWVIYTAQILMRYVNDKIRSDQDVALAPWTYLARHLLAFTSGHVPFPAPLTLLPWLALLSALGLLLWSLWRRHDQGVQPPAPMAQSLLWLCFVVPFAAAFLINQFYPFFPTGGERLLLFVLPYFLFLLSSALDDLGRQRQLRWHAVRMVTFALLITTAAVGAWVFYTLPRYQADDYRPLIRQIVQQGRDNDTVIATFPWQVGFWRAYAPQVGLTADAGPQIRLLSDRSVVWDATVAQQLDEALTHGMLWLPSLRSIGSTLPAAMTNYLNGRAVNFAQQWVSITTQLDAWHRRTPIVTTALAYDWGDVQLASAGVNITTLPAANTPLIVALGWRSQGVLPTVGVTLRLQKDGLTWAYRDYAALGAFATERQDDLVMEQVGLLVPPGLPPGDYQLVIGLVDPTAMLRKPTHRADPHATLLPLATIAVTTPTAILPPYRLPMQFPLDEPVLTEGVALLGHSGGDAVIMAGTDLALTLFWQKGGAALSDRHLYVSLLDGNGAGVAGWAGWTLPAYPFAQWPAGALVQTPLAFTIPATVGSGAYGLVAGLLDPVTGVKQPPIALGAIRVYQRQANFTLTPPPTPLPQPAQFGAHVQLLGYEQQRQGEQLVVTLYWQVLQPLLPPHHIFVHLDDAAGVTLAQADDAPQTATEPAPTGSWQPGEYLVTHHTLTVPMDTDPAAVLRVGLYVPESGVRLPVTIAGASAGDAVSLPAKP